MILTHVRPVNHKTPFHNQITLVVKKDKSITQIGFPKKGTLKLKNY